MKLLYFKVAGEASEPATNKKLTVEVFVPKITKLFTDGEKRSLKTALVRLVFQSMSFGKTRLFCARDEKNGLAHVSYVVPKCFKFPFMKRGDFEIGPCVTEPQYRGQGIYPYMLTYICTHICKEHQPYNGTIYMLVNSKNTASIRGIEKAGFTQCGTVRESKLLKRYFLK